MYTLLPPPRTRSCAVDYLLVVAELVSALQQPDLDGDLDDVAHRLLRLVLVPRLSIIYYNVKETLPECKPAKV